MAITIPPPYAVKVDLNNDGDYGDANETLIRVMSVTWRNGFQAMHESVCRDSTATVTVDNAGGQYSPEHASAIAGLTRGKKLQITCTLDVTEHVMFTGWVAGIQPVPGQFGEQTARLSATSWVDKAGRAETSVPLMADVTADVALETAIEKAACLPPGISAQSWLLGISGYSEIGVKTYLGQVSNYIAADTGVSTFGLIGDKWADDIKVIAAVREAVGREFGRLFLRRDGKLEFWNRNHLPAITIVSQSYAGTMNGMEYEYTTLLYNQITVRAHSRKVGVAPEVLSSYAREVLVPPSGSKSITYRYASGDSGVKIAGRDVIVPISGIDFEARTGSAGAGDEAPANLSVSVTRESATSCEVRFTNLSGGDMYIQVDSRIRGTKITDYGAVTVTERNDASISANGVYAYAYPIPVESETEAQYMANYLLDLFKDPRGYIKSISIEAYTSTAFLTDAVTLGIGSRITVTEAKTNASGDYFIIGEEHTVSASPARHRVKWTLEPAALYAYWLLGASGFGELGQTTVLGPL